MSELEPTSTELEPTATERLRALLDERGVEHFDGTECTLWGYEPTGECTGAYRYAADEVGHDRMTLRLFHVTPEQAIAATLGSCNCSNNYTNGERTSDSDATGARQLDAGKVYLVEACDELIEGWYPLVAYLSREAAGRHAESLRGEVDGVMSFARVIEMEVRG